MIDYKYADLYYEDSIHKQLNIEAEDGSVITNDDIYSEEMSLSESLCSESSLTFGCCEASCLQIKIANRFSPLYGQWLTVTETLDDNTDESFLFGTYKVQSDKPTADRSYRDITAYDAMYDIINADGVDVADWYNEILPDYDSTVTLKELRQSFLAHLGIEEIDANLVNDNMIVEKTIETSSLSGQRVISAICEINGVFAHINRNGKLEYIQLDPIDEDKAFDIPFHKFSDYEDFETEVINCLQIREDDSDPGVVYGSGANRYIIQGNFLLYGKSTEDLITITENLYPVINNISYRPSTITVPGNPCIEVGDIIHLSTQYQEIYTYVLKREFKGIQALDDTYTSEGTETYVDDGGSLTEKIEQIKSRTSELASEVKENTESINVAIERIDADYGEFLVLVADVANIQTMFAEYARIEELEAALARIDELYVDYEEVNNLVVQNLEAVYADIEMLTAGLADIHNLFADYATIDSLTALVAYIGSEYVSNSTITELLAGYASIDDLYAITASIETLNVDVANIISLLAGEAGVGILEAIHLTTDNAVIDEAVIVEALVGTVLANIIESNVIYTDQITIMSEDGGITITGNQVINTNGQWLFYDSDGNIRMQIGQDASGNFSFILYDETGEGIMLDSEGIHASAIPDGLIVDSMVADDANIAASKLDIDDLTQTLNENGQLVLTAEQITIGGGTLDYALTQITQQISDLESLEGVDTIVNYYAITTNPDWYPPHESTGTDTSILGELILGEAVLGFAGEESWTTERLVAGEGEYLWYCQKVTYTDGHIVWTTPTLITDDYIHNIITIQQTELEVVQGQIQAKIWQSDIDTAVNSLGDEISTITDQYALLTVTLGEIDARVGQLTTTVTENYTELSSQVTAITANLEGITLEVRDVYEKASNAIVEGVPYYATSGNADWYPPHEADGDTSILGEMVLGNAVLGFSGDDWTTEQPDYQEGQYIWLSYLRTRVDGTTYWTEPTLLTDEWARQNFAYMSERYAQIVVEVDSIVAEVVNVQSLLTDNYSTTSEVRAAIEMAVEDSEASILIVVSDLETEVTDEFVTMSTRMATIESNLDSISLTVTNVESKTANAIVEGTPYYAVSGNPNWYPPHESNGSDTSVLGKMILGTAVLGFSGDGDWTTEQPSDKEGQYVWISYLRTRVDGSTYWTDPTLLTDEYARLATSELSMQYSQLVLTLDSALLEVYNLVSTLDGSMKELDASIRLYVDDETASIRSDLSYYATITDVTTQITNATNEINQTISNTENSILIQVSETYVDFGELGDTLFDYSKIDETVVKVETYYAVSNNPDYPSRIISDELYSIDLTNEVLPEGWKLVNNTYNNIIEYYEDDVLGACYRICHASVSAPYIQSTEKMTPEVGRKYRVEFEAATRSNDIENAIARVGLGIYNNQYAETNPGDLKSDKWTNLVLDFENKTTVTGSLTICNYTDYTLKTEIYVKNAKLSSLSEEEIEWSNEYPSISTGQYLWVRNLITYADGTQEWGEPYCITTDAGMIDLSDYPTFAVMNASIETYIGNSESYILSQVEGTYATKSALATIEQKVDANSAAINEEVEYRSAYYSTTADMILYVGEQIGNFSVDISNNYATKSELSTVDDLIADLQNDSVASIETYYAVSNNPDSADSVDTLAEEDFTDGSLDSCSRLNNTTANSFEFVTDENLGACYRIVSGGSSAPGIRFSNSYTLEVNRTYRYKLEAATEDSENQYDAIIHYGKYGSLNESYAGNLMNSGWSTFTIDYENSSRQTSQRFEVDNYSDYSLHVPVLLKSMGLYEVTSEAEWSVDYPTTITPNDYVWVRFLVTYIDGHTEYTEPVCITTNTRDFTTKGQMKATIDASIDDATANILLQVSGTYATQSSLSDVSKLVDSSVSDIEIYYAVNNNPDSISSSATWTTTIPSVNDGQYLWFRHKITYIDGSIEWTTPSRTTPDLSSYTNTAGMQSYVDSKLASLTLSVENGELGSKATIKMTAGTEELGSASVDLSGVRQAFADDGSKIEISAGTILFLTNTFLVDSENLTVEADGTIYATNGIFNGTIMSMSDEPDPRGSYYTTIISDCVFSVYYEDNKFAYIRPMYEKNDPTSKDPGTFGFYGDGSICGGLTFGFYTEGTTTAYYYYLLNNTLNPDGYSQKHQFFGDAIFKKSNVCISSSYLYMVSGYGIRWCSDDTCETIYGRIFANADNLYIYSNVGDIYLNGSQYSSSDKSLKTDIGYLSTDVSAQLIESIDKLEPAEFEWTNKQADKGKHYGYIANDVQKVMPELVRMDEDGILCLAYDEIIPLLHIKIKQLETRIKQLEQAN